MGFKDDFQREAEKVKAQYNFDLILPRPVLLAVHPDYAKLVSDAMEKTAKRMQCAL